MSRISKHEYFLQIAETVSKRGTCDRLRVGAVVVSADGHILSTGYNGSPPNMPHCDDPEVGHLLEHGHCVRTVHGETNALLQAAKTGGPGIAGSTLYLTHDPCPRCLMHMATAGIVRLVFRNLYKPRDVPAFLQECKKLGIDAQHGSQDAQEWDHDQARKRALREMMDSYY